MITQEKVLFQIPIVIGKLENINNDIIIKDALDNRYNKLSEDVSNTHFEDSYLPMSDELNNVFTNIISDIQNKIMEGFIRISTYSELNSCGLENENTPFGTLDECKENIS